MKHANFSRVNIGLFCSTPGVALARAVPRKVALEMLFTGNPITAEGEVIWQMCINLRVFSL